MVKEIICKTDGAVILVDDEDYPLLARFPWYRGGMGKHPMTFIYGKKDTSQTVYMHQIIMGGVVNADHIDMNVLNMQKSNLRLATYQQNGWNKAKPKRTDRPPTSRFKGVTYAPLKGKDRWLVVISLGRGKGVDRVGYFFDEVEAAKAYNKRVLELRGKFAWLNPIPGESDNRLNINNSQVH